MTPLASPVGSPTAGQQYRFVARGRRGGRPECDGSTTCLEPVRFDDAPRPPRRGCARVAGVDVGGCRRGRDGGRSGGRGIPPADAHRFRHLGGFLCGAFEGLAATAPQDGPARLSVGMRVCFTGTATISGSATRRDRLEGLAEAFGLTVVAGVTRTCDLLVAADPLSQSGKAAKARDYGTPIISTEDFLGLLTA